ncbi:MAG TPA: GWxTD domain-containing protein [Candidatus Cloacimonas sp.]|nr:GWxTD domain-containing protein [Candidatus Cloacimonas sp.]
MKNIRFLLLSMALCLAFNVLIAQPRLNMFLDSNRFLDKNQQTILLLDYQVPYPSLVFLAQNNGYFAELKVVVQFVEADSILMQQEVTDNIGIRNKADAANRQKSYLNRLSFILDKPSTEVVFQAVDQNSQKVFNWRLAIDKLDPQSLISDIELNTEVRPDSLQYLAKFQRNNTLYKPEPSGLINKNLTDNLFLYLESYSSISDQSILLNLSLTKDSLLIMDEYLDFVPKQNNESLSLKIPLESLRPGTYRGAVVVQNGNEIAEQEFDFVLFEEAEEQFFLFPDPESEYTLMSYFPGSKLPSDWKALSLDKQRRYCTEFWRSLGASKGRSPQDMIKLIKERIDYANQHFSHLKNGWTSDMGRIYIRYGAPDDVQRETSSDESRFVRKDFEIWKYSKENKPVYLFIDIQMNGNYRLIYVDNDDMEATNPDWIRFVGSDFDTGKLDN